MNSDEWTKPIIVNGKQISGGAAREHRVKKAGGVKHIVDTAYAKGVYDMAKKLVDNANTSNLFKKQVFK